MALLLVLPLAIPCRLLAADAPPPPTTIHDQPQARETIEPEEHAPNLNREFEHLNDDERVQVHAYTRNDGARIEEYSIHGHVYMIKVQPAGGLPAYYLYDQDGDGTFDQRLPGGYKRPSPPMWVIKRF
ncbi:MAG: DUF2782 domain-containing protein [Zetaproteobacteria bacterium]|nr:MAG: DUF2782 domain-containing protein [Zetaproteobacteria bacterium]